MNCKKAQESLSSLATTLLVSKDLDIIQVNNNTQTTMMAKEQDGISEQGENSCGCSQPKRQNPSIDKDCVMRSCLDMMIMPNVDLVLVYSSVLK